MKRAAEAKNHEDSIRHRLQTIGELAVQRAYSTESVQQFFNAVRGLDWEPLGILADFVEVDPEYEAVVEDFLRWKLQYVVVQDRAQAERAIEMVKKVSKGRLDCLVLNGGATHRTGGADRRRGAAGERRSIRQPRAHFISTFATPMSWTRRTRAWRAVGAVSESGIRRSNR